MAGLLAAFVAANHPEATEESARHELEQLLQASALGWVVGLGNGLARGLAHAAGERLALALVPAPSCRACASHKHGCFQRKQIALRCL